MLVVPRCPKCKRRNLRRYRRNCDGVHPLYDASDVSHINNQELWCGHCHEWVKPDRKGDQ